MMDKKRKRGQKRTIKRKRCDRNEEIERKKEASKIDKN